MIEQPCVGYCNASWRRATKAHEEALQAWTAAEEAHGVWRRAAAQNPEEAGPEPERSDRPEPPTIKPWYGTPIWCRKCAAAIRSCLSNLDEIMSLRLAMADGFEVPGAPLGEKVRKTKGADPGSPSPAQDDLDELLDWLREWEQALRDSQGWPSVPYRGKAAPALTSALSWWLPRLDTILTHPDLAHGFGDGVLQQHSQLERVTRTRPPMRHKPLPCPRCRRRSLFLHDDESIRCSNEDCRRVMSEREYEEYEAEADKQVAS